MLVRFLSACISLPLLGQPTETSNPNSPVARINGTVADVVTSRPIDKVSLTLRPLILGTDRVTHNAVTTSEGKFSFDNVKPGIYILMADRDGYVRGQAYGPRAGFSGSPITLVAGQHVKDLEFPLIPGAAVSGKIMNEASEPISGASVSLMQYRYEAGRRDLRALNGAVTNDKGEFRISDVAPGKYYLRARMRSKSAAAPSISRASETPQKSGYATTHYANSKSPEGATPLYVPMGGEVAGIRIELSRTPVFRVTGRVHSAQGLAEKTRLTMFPGTATTGAGDLAHVDESSGNFAFSDVEPGSYTIVASALAGSRGLNKRVAVNVVDEDLTNVRIEIDEGFDLAGVLGFEEEPRDFKISKIRVFLHPLDSSVLNPLMAQVEDDGKFLVRRVLRERYRLSVAGAPPGAYVKSVRLGSRTLPSSELSFAFEVPSQLQVVLSTNGGAITGIVTNEKAQPVPKAVVTLSPAKGPYAPGISGRIGTGADGRFQFRGLPPGEYELLAWEEIEMGLPDMEDFRREFRTYAVTANVEEKSALNVSATLIPRTAIEAVIAKLP